MHAHQDHAGTTAKPVDVFISFAPADQPFLAELEKGLALVRRQELLRAWHRGRVGAGEHRDAAVASQLEAARLVLLLVSRDFLASDDCYNIDIKSAIERHRMGRVRVIPILLRACDWTTAAFGGLQPLPNDGRAITSWTNNDEAWANVVEGIKAALAQLTAGSDTDPVVEHTPRRAKSVPTYPDARTRMLSEQLEGAHARKKALQDAGATTGEVDAEILHLKREIRKGGQLNAGDSLGDGRFLLLERLGKGGFATVWKAQDRDTGAHVAVKVLYSELAGDHVRRERLFRGARAMAQLAHEAVVRVLEPRGEDDGYYYFAMELVAGGDLRQAVLQQRLSPGTVVSLILLIGEVLTEAHARGLIHRDVKPANILLDAFGRPKLADFDLVAGANTTGGTRTAPLGTFIYAAPELLSDPKDADVRADVFGLAMTAIFCLYGCCYQRDLPQIVLRDPDSIIALLPCNDAAKHVLRRAVDWEREKRFDGMLTFCQSLRAATSPLPAQLPHMTVEPKPDYASHGDRDRYIGMTFDHRYKIERLLGEGGMGFVYLARHKVIGKKVAVKVLRAELARDEEIFERFVLEARAASSVGNPHIVDVSDFGDLPDGSKYFVMEYLEGISLSQIIDGPDEIPIDRVYKIGQQMADGLAAAHTGGIVHRDLKPDNVYVVHHSNDPDFVKILDFGIAKVTTDVETKLTRAGAVFGTPHYMSPEQAAGAPIDHRTDIYSMGVMLYELVTRQLPFTADNFMGILMQHMYKPPVPPRQLLSGPGLFCPPSLEAIILKCLSKRPEARYETMDQLRVDLEMARTGGMPVAVPEMMARTGGFSVLSAYPMPTPARPFQMSAASQAGVQTRRPIVPLIMAILISTVALGFVIVVATKPKIPPESVPLLASAQPVRMDIWLSKYHKDEILAKYNLAHALDSAGRGPEALAAWQVYLESGPDEREFSESVAYAKSRIALLKRTTADPQ